MISLQGYFMGVNCFFILSSYLLSYRLYLDFQSSNHKFKEHLLIILKYFVRRLCRIYLPFVTCAAIIIKISHHFKLFYRYNTFWDTILMRRHEKNHLWTIAPEIQYYCFVPMIIYFFYRFRKYSTSLLFFLSILIVYIDFFEPSVFWRRNSIFLKATVFAIFYSQLEQKAIFQKIRNSKKIRILMGFSISILFYLIIRKFSRFFQIHMTWEKGSLSAEYHTLLLFILVLIGAPNFITEFLENKILQNLGKYSFGIYLWHVMCIDIVNYESKMFLENKQSRYYLGRLSNTEKFMMLFLHSYICGWLFFNLIESPLMRIANFLCEKISNILE